MLNTSHQMRMIKPFPLSISLIWDGKQMFANFKHTMLITENTATIRKLSNWPKPSRNLRKTRKPKNLDLNPVKNSKMLWIKLNLGLPSIN